MAYRAFYALPVENFQTSTGQHTNAVHGFVSMLIGLLTAEKPSHVAVAFDVGRESFRNETYPEYKATRSASPQEFRGQVELIKEVLDGLRISHVELPGYEADDIIATMATRAEAAGYEVLISTGDRDALQLVTDHTTVLYPRKGVSDMVRMTPAVVEEKYLVPPQRYPELAALVGETSDNLPGVPGVGPKTAAKWINTYDGLANIIERAEQVPGKAGQSLRDHLDEVRRNRRLNRLLRDLELPLGFEQTERRDWDREAITQLFAALEFRSLKERLSQLYGNNGDEQNETREAFTVTGRALEPGEVATWLEENAEGDGESDEETGTRRRRRRRRRSSGSESKGGTGDEVTGIEGSTRMEAKRQRRKENRAAGRRRAPILSEAEFLARRESVDRKLVIRQREDYTQLAVVEDGILVEHYVDRASATSLIGNVYLGRVQNVLPSMEAAFIDIGRGRNAVLYAGEVDWDSYGVTAEDRKVEKVFKSGQTVLVQVTKDPIGAKGARLTGHISLPGRYIVYSPGGHLSGISRKLPDVERTRLRRILGELIGDNESVIVRTAAEGVAAEELVRDVNRLKAQWEVIEKKVKAGKAPEALYSEPDLTLRIVRDLFTEDFAKLTVQGDDAHEAISAYVGHVAPHLADRIERFEPGEDGRDLFAQYRIDEQIAKALDRKVFLPSGGSLVIDRTEAMTVIDVNTGRFTGSGGNLEATVTSNNLEAAEEIVRQLRLRDLGGIVVIDFIDMVLPSNRELLLRRLVECLGRDRTRHQVAEVTSLGLVQLTRKRIGTGLAEAFTEECDHCHGSGYLRFDNPVDSQAPADGGERRSGRRRRKNG